MRKINYRPGKLMMSAIASLLIAAWLGYGWGPEDSPLWLIGTAAFAYLAFASIRTAVGNRPALAFDDRSVTINTLHRGSTHAWHDVGEIMVERMAVRYFGLIPGSTKDFLCFRIDRGSGIGRRHRINARLIELPVGGLPALHGDLSTARAAAMGSTSKDPGVASPTSDAPGFDPDAAIARYLAAKQAEAPVPSPLAGNTPTPFARGPARPTFGRRTG